MSRLEQQSVTPQETLQKLLSNQYFLVFRAPLRKKAGFLSVKVETDLPNSKILAPNNVWVTGAAVE